LLSLHSRLSFLIQAFKLIWTLSFESEFKSQLLKAGILEVFGKFDHLEGHAQKAKEGALWVLQEEEKHPENISEKHVMISYSWMQKEKMRALAFFLKEKGLPIWLDVEQMEGSVLEKMSEAIENASVVVIGISAAYKESQACRTEAEYAYRLKKEVVFVMTEESYAPRGWLGAMLGNKLWYNPWIHPQGFNLGMEEVFKVVSKALGSPEQSLPSPSPPPSSPSPSPSTPLPSGGVPNVAALTAEDFEGSKISQWSPEKSCQWLRMCGMAELEPLFLKHSIQGETLLWWGKMKTPGFLMVCQQVGITNIGQTLWLQRRLKHLLLLSGSSKEEVERSISSSLAPPPVVTKEQVKGWSKGQVEGWLEGEGLQGIREVARREGWEGETLYSLLVAFPSSLPLLLPAVGLSSSSHELPRLVSALSAFTDVD